MKKVCVVCALAVMTIVFSGGRLWASAPRPTTGQTAAVRTAVLFLVEGNLFASVRVMGPNNKEIPYALCPRASFYPIGKGWQKVAYRALDLKMSTIYRPWHLNTKQAYAPLQSASEVVPVNVELEPMTALVRKGDRIRLDIQPEDGCAWGRPHVLIESYHRGPYTREGLMLRICTCPSSRWILNPIRRCGKSAGVATARS